MRMRPSERPAFEQLFVDIGMCSQCGPGCSPRGLSDAGRNVTHTSSSINPSILLSSVPCTDSCFCFPAASQIHTCRTTQSLGVPTMRCAPYILHPGLRALSFSIRHGNMAHNESTRKIPPLFASTPFSMFVRKCVT